MPELIDLSHSVSDGKVTYPGIPAPVICDFLLKDNKVSLVGIDSLNIDDLGDLKRPVHSTLLGANIPIVEHMCRLDRLPDSSFIFHAAPVKVHEFGTFPVRAYAVVKTG